MIRILSGMIGFTVVTVCAGANAQGLSGSAGDAPGGAAGLPQCVSDLASREFEVRQRAAEILKKSSAEQIQQLGEAIHSNPDNEVVRRLIEILEARYQQPDRTASEVAAASEALESAAKSDRWFVAEAARDILKRHGRRRVELAVTELVDLGASISPKDPTELWKARQDLDHFTFRRNRFTRTDQLQIFVKDSWPKGPRGMELLCRLESLASSRFLRETGDIVIVLVEGQPLSIEEVGVLKGIFGDAPLQERGRVSLGISPDSPGADSGVTVGVVKSQSSADIAGLLPGDVITAINDDAVADFEALVAILRKYRVGDRVTLRVLKNTNTRTGEPQTYR